jgi:DNA-binding response OmpR family regulator
MSRMNVLIIEGEISTQQIYKRIFQRAEVTCVESGEEALIKILENPSRWDLIVADQKLAGRIPGRDIYVHLAEYHPHLSQRFIFATRCGSELAGLDIASDRVLSKPFESYEMVNAVRGTQLHERQAI